MAGNSLPCIEKHDCQIQGVCHVFTHTLASSGNTELLSWRARANVVRANLGELASLPEQRRLSTTDRNGEYHMPVQIAGPHRIGRAPGTARRTVLVPGRRGPGPRRLTKEARP